MFRTAGTIPRGSDAKETFFEKHVNIFFKRIFFVAEQFLVLYRYLFSYLLIFVVSSRLPIYTTLSCVQDHPLRVEQPHTSLSLVHLTIYTYNNELLMDTYVRQSCVWRCMGLQMCSNAVDIDPQNPQNIQKMRGEAFVMTIRMIQRLLYISIDLQLLN